MNTHLKANPRRRPSSRRPKAPRRQPKPPFPRQRQRKPGIEALISPRPRFQGAGYRPAGKLEGMRAIVTGGDSGIGRAVAVFYAKEGADVAVVYLRAEQRDAEETRRTVEALGRRCLLLPGDVSDPKFCREAVERTVKELGGLEILVNNAAYQGSKGGLEDITDEEWEKTFRTNIHGYFYMARAALKHLRPGASIINCGSVVGFRGSEKLLDYGATKGAIHAFTRSLALNLKEREIRVNGVAPGPVWTPLNVSDRPPKDVAKFGEKAPMGRPGQPEEIAPAFVFLASNADSSYMTGEIMALTGGEAV